MRSRISVHLGSDRSGSQLEAAIREVAEVNFIESTSRAGVSIITLELKAAVTRLFSLADLDTKTS